MDKDKKVIGFSSLKGVSTLKDEIENLITRKEATWEVNSDYHFGGYAKRTAGLIDFMRTTKLQQNIDLDPVYTAKMMFGVIDLVYKGRFPAGSTVLVLHTGGLQAGLYDKPIQKDFQTLQ
jgi:1-aminocyclopropane-1-carboxylate deaminase